MMEMDDKNRDLWDNGIFNYVLITIISYIKAIQFIMTPTVKTW